MKSNPQELYKDFEKRARSVYQDSIKLMREGFHGLEVVAGKTMEVTKIKLANQRALNDIRQLFTDLGQRVFDSVMNPSKNGYIKITPDVSQFAAQIKKLQKSMEENLNKLREISISEPESYTTGVKNKLASEVSKQPKTNSKQKRNRVKKKSVSRKKS